MSRVTSIERKGTITFGRRLQICMLVGAALLGPVRLGWGSDHADPIRLRELEAGITDLFAFPKGDNLVLILGIRPGLTTSPPLPLEPYTYAIHIDHHSEVNFDSEDVNARYGGKVVEPSGIAADVTFEFRLSNAAEIREMTVRGLPTRESVSQPFVGLRDDPFIFYRFLSTNVIAIVIEVPFDQFPAGRSEFLIWGTSKKFGRQIDHVGRSLRTMLPRFNFLNTLHPSEHVQEIRRRHTDPGVIEDVLATYASPVFGIRHYDFEPDVMIYSRNRQPQYPNGRQLTDDVAKLICEQGDCLLWEVSLAEAHADHQPRPSMNNKPFLDEFPYLAEVNPERPAGSRPSLRMRTKVILGLAGGFIAVLFLLPWYLLWRTRRNLRRLLKSPIA